MTEVLNKKSNPLQIKVGDTVEIFFEHNKRDGAFLADVTRIEGRTDIGQDAIIDYRRHDGKTNGFRIPDACSVSHVVRVVARAPYQVTRGLPPRNVFRERLHEKRDELRGRDYGWIGWYTFGGIRVGLRDSLVTAALATARDELTRRYNPTKFHALWERSGYIGRVQSPDEFEYPPEHYTCVRWKTFRRFVLANRHKMLETRKELEQSGRDYRDAMDESYLKDLDDEEEWRREKGDEFEMFP